MAQQEVLLWSSAVGPMSLVSRSPPGPVKRETADSTLVDGGRVVELLIADDEVGEAAADERSLDDLAVDEAEVEGRESSAESSSVTSSRAARNLPAPGDSFDCSDDFFQSCAEAIAATGPGYLGYKLTNKPTTLAFACRARSFGCCWKITTKGEQSEGWVIDGQLSTFEHDHEADDEEEGEEEEEEEEEDNEEEAPPTSTEGDSRRAHRLDKARTTRSPHTSSPSTASGSSSSAPSASPSATSSPGSSPTIPGAPKVGESYSSIPEAIQHYFDVVVPVLGISVSNSSAASYFRYLRCNSRARKPPCPYVIKLAEPEDDEGPWIVDVSSNLRHNHGPCKQILKNPNWRPLTRSFPNRRARARKATQAEVEQGVEVSSSDEDGSQNEAERVAEEGRADPMIKPDRRRRASSSSSVEGVADARSAHHSAKKRRTTESEFLARDNRAFRPSLSSSLPRRPQSTRNSTLPTPRPSTTSSPAVFPAPSTEYHSPTFITSLRTFLSSLHPSLVSSAQLLFDAGIKSSPLLVAFVGLSDRARDNLLQDVNMPLLQRHLLKNKLKQAISAAGMRREG